MRDTISRGDEITINYVAYGSSYLMIAKSTSKTINPQGIKPWKTHKEKIVMKLNNLLKSTYRVEIDAGNCGSITKEFDVR